MANLIKIESNKRNISSYPIEKRNNQGHNRFAGFGNTLDIPAQPNGARWYGYVLRNNSEDLLRKALDFEEIGRRWRGRPKRSWRSRVKNHI